MTAPGHAIHPTDTAHPAGGAFSLAAWGLAVAAIAAPVHAGAAADAEAPEWRYVAGLSFKSAPEYDGSDRRVLKVRPLWAYKYGRFRISTSGASAIMGFASDPVGSGVSAELVRTDHWKLGTALRLDSGRQSSDSARLTGLPDIQRTLRGRLYATYSIDDRWGISGNVAQDLLGRQGGATFGLNLGYRRWMGAQTMVSAGAGVSLADRRNMQTYFGITDGQAVRTGLPAYSPGGGLTDIHAGVGVMTAIAPRWIAFANVGASTLIGDAATSPLTRQASAALATFGLAYRCCK